MLLGFQRQARFSLSVWPRAGNEFGSSDPAQTLLSIGAFIDLGSPLDLYALRELGAARWHCMLPFGVACKLLLGAVCCCMMGLVAVCCFCRNGAAERDMHCPTKRQQSQMLPLALYVSFWR